MSSVWLALLFTAAALGLTYVCCLRPMRRGQCVMSGPANRTRRNLDDAREQARTDLAELKAKTNNNDLRPSSPGSDRPDS